MDFSNPKFDPEDIFRRFKISGGKRYQFTATRLFVFLCMHNYMELPSQAIIASIPEEVFEEQLKQANQLAEIWLEAGLVRRKPKMGDKNNYAFIRKKRNRKK